MRDANAVAATKNAMKLNARTREKHRLKHCCNAEVLW